MRYKSGHVILIILMQLLMSSSLATTLNRGNGVEPKTLDFHKSTGVSEANILRDLFTGLVVDDADGKISAGVASEWQQSDDGLRWTFKLRKDSHWSDGSVVTAHDFVYAFKRAVNPATLSEYAFILWQIKHAKGISKGEIKDINQLGVTASDDYTLLITLEHPVPYLPSLLTHNMAYPLSKKTIDKHGKQWMKPNKMVSNGAYQLAEWVPHSHIKLTKNPHFYAADSVSIDTVVYFPIEDKGAELKRFRSGELDITEDVPSSQMNWIKENLADNFHNAPYMGTYYLAMNLDKAPFTNNPTLRRALSLALRRNILTEKITQAGEFATLNWVPSGVNNYKVVSTEEGKMSSKQRLALAKKLYAKAGFSKENPVEIELLYNTSENHKKIAIAIAAMWKQTLGVKTTLRNEEWKVYLHSRTQRQFHLMRASWIGDYNDASTFLDLLRSDIGTMNPSGWKNAKYDQLLKGAAVETEPSKREALMQKAEVIMLNETPIIPIYHYTSKHLVSKKVTGWNDNVMDVHPSRYLSITP
ncbi:MAG: peptide ABC transporter substrate-binding protein [Thiotrichaceae bacterium]|nr:peptide ABC transporter substrate-binding protein [Thiotrichaceae bacterium]